MDRTSEYAAIVKRLLTEYGTYKPSYGEVEVETVFDETRGHYELMYVGWKDGRRIHDSVIHIDLKNGKVWLQHDSTNLEVATELVREGIPKDQIVLAFHHPNRRQYTDFAVS